MCHAQNVGGALISWNGIPLTKFGAISASVVHVPENQKFYKMMPYLPWWADGQPLLLSTLGRPLC